MHFIAPQLGRDALWKLLSVSLFGKTPYFAIWFSIWRKKRTLFDWEELVLEQSETLSHGQIMLLLLIQLSPWAPASCFGNTGCSNQNKWLQHDHRTDLSTFPARAVQHGCLLLQRTHSRWILVSPGKQSLELPTSPPPPPYFVIVFPAVNNRSGGYFSQAL